MGCVHPKAKGDYGSVKCLLVVQLHLINLVAHFMQTAVLHDMFQLYILCAERLMATTGVRHLHPLPKSSKASLPLLPKVYYDEVNKRMSCSEAGSRTTDKVACIHRSHCMLLARLHPRCSCAEAGACSKV